MPAVGADPSKRLVPDELWELVAPLLPSFTDRPQGGGTAPRDERAVSTAVVYVADQRLCLAASAADVRHVLRHRASPLHGVDRGRPVASAASGRCWTNSGPGARWTGPRRSSTRPPFAPKGGIADGAEPGRSRQDAVLDHGHRQQPRTARAFGDLHRLHRPWPLRTCLGPPAPAVNRASTPRAYSALDR